MELTITLAVLITLFAGFWIYSSNKNGRLSIPGPPGYPIIGNLLDADLNLLHLKLYEWYQLYGDVFKFRLFNTTFVVVSSSTKIRELFCEEPTATFSSGRPETFAQKYLFFNSDVAFTSLDKEWILRRKLLYKQIHAYGEGMKKLEKSMITKLSEMKKKITSDTSCDPQDLVNDFVVSILEILLVGKNQGLDSDFHRLLIEFTDVANNFMNPGLDTLFKTFPFLRFLSLSPSKAYKRAMEIRKELLDFLEKQTVEGYIGTYHSMKELLNSEEAPWFTKTTMISLLMDLIGGGFLTTKSALSFLIRILMSQPEVQQKLQQEVDRVIGHKRQPVLADRAQMPYSEAVILETLRFVSQLPLSILHEASADFIFDNITIPKGTVIIPCIWTMHHNEKEWKDPFKFDPDRFLNANGELLPADHEIRKRFMSFSCGKRTCIGESFAKSRMFLFLTTLMQICTVQAPTGEVMEMLDPRKSAPGIILQPQKFDCTFVTRPQYQLHRN